MLRQLSWTSSMMSLLRVVPSITTPERACETNVVEKLCQYIVFLTYLLICTIRLHSKFMAKCKVRSICRCIDMVDNNRNPYLGVFFR